MFFYLVLAFIYSNIFLSLGVRDLKLRLDKALKTSLLISLITKEVRAVNWYRCKKKMFNLTIQNFSLKEFLKFKFLKYKANDKREDQAHENVNK